MYELLPPIVATGRRAPSADQAEDLSEWTRYSGHWQSLGRGSLGLSDLRATRALRP
jgi:hypothetical protein